MNLKDIIFVALIILSGLFFYLHGVDTGIRRTRRLFERYLGNPEGGTKVHFRGARGVFSKSSVQGIFGRN